MYREKKGVAIRYTKEMQTPEILAIARGHLVEKLLDLARENGITIYRDSNLTEILSTMTTGEEIPENLYLAVSEVLTYCYNVNEKFREKLNHRRDLDGNYK